MTHCDEKHRCLRRKTKNPGTLSSPGFSSEYGVPVTYFRVRKRHAEKRNAIAPPDDFSHEIAPCALVRNRGLVVVTGCGHRGVINTLRRAMAASGTRKVHAVMGGFHLQPEKPEYVRQTVAALKEIDPDYVVPMRCTGDLFTQLVEQELSGRLIRCYTGTRLTFS